MHVHALSATNALFRALSGFTLSTGGIGGDRRPRGYLLGLDGALENREGVYLVVCHAEVA